MTLETVHTWFDRHHGHALAALVSGMMAVQRDATRAKNVHSAIYWYIRASDFDFEMI
jgi:hypothetical protein